MACGMTLVIGTTAITSERQARRIHSPSYHAVVAREQVKHPRVRTTTRRGICIPPVSTFVMARGLASLVSRHDGSESDA